MSDQPRSRGHEALTTWTDEPYRSPDQTPMLRPSINIRVEYRQLGPGPESIEVQWDDGTTTPSAHDICTVIAALLRPAEEASTQ